MTVLVMHWLGLEHSRSVIEIPAVIPQALQTLFAICFIHPQPWEYRPDGVDAILYRQTFANIKVNAKTPG